MTRGKASGIKLRQNDAPLIMGMVARGDRDHDIAAWFGVNQGRIAEVKDGTKFGQVTSAPANTLPPKGPPGIKGKRLRAAVTTAVADLTAGDTAAGIKALRSAMQNYDANEA
jgi:hypothetical protein